MKIGFLSDCHAHNHQQFSTALPNGRNSRLQDILGVVDQFHQSIIEENVAAAFVLGDVFHSRDRLNVDVFCSTFRAFQKFAQTVPLYMLVGNHDQYNRTGTIHSLEAFKTFATVIDQPTIGKIGNITYAAIPHTIDREVFTSFVKSIKSVDLFLAHQAIKEATTGPLDHCPKHGMSVEDLPYDRAKFCLLGDYHNGQMLKDNVGYIGSPYMLDFGERNARKGWQILDTDTWTLRLVESKAPKFKVYQTVDEFIADCNNSLCDPLYDFVRVISARRTEEVEQLSVQFPKVQVEYKEIEDQANLRVPENIVHNDKELIMEFITQHAGELDNKRAFDLAINLFNEEE